MRISWPATSASGGPSSTRTRARRRLEQHGVSLPDVEEGHAKAGRRVPRRRRSRGDPCRGEENSAGGEHASDHLLLRRETSSILPNDEPRHGRADVECERSGDIHSRGWQIGDDPGDELQPRRRPTRRAPRARRQPTERPGRPPRRAARTRGRAERPETRRRSPARCRPAPDRSGRGRSARSQATGEGDGKRLRERRRKREAVELAPDARNGDEDRGDGGEGQLEAGLQERRRHPRHQHQRADREEVPTIARARGEPRQRSESSGDRGARHRRLPADGEHVGGNDTERCELP